MGMATAVDFWREKLEEDGGRRISYAYPVSDKHRIILFAAPDHAGHRQTIGVFFGNTYIEALSAAVVAVYGETK